MTELAVFGLAAIGSIMLISWLGDQEFGIAVRFQRGPAFPPVQTEEFMSEYTKGPWALVVLKDGSCEIDIVSDARPHICTVHPGAIEGVTEANASLIAASPDLLEALIGVVRVADRATIEFDAARAAIAKATAHQQANRRE